MNGIKLISSFALTGAAFLDERQGVAEVLSQLKSWDPTKVGIPDGFEVYVRNERKWYTYDSRNENNSTTGYFREREGAAQTPVITKELVIIPKGFLSINPGYTKQMILDALGVDEAGFKVLAINIIENKTDILIEHSDSGYLMPIMFDAGVKNIDSQVQYIIQMETKVGNVVTNTKLAYTQQTGTIKVTQTSETQVTNSTINAMLSTKQDKLVAGKNISIQGNVISSSGDELPNNLVYLEETELEKDCNIIGEILNSLDSERADAALSAKQGKTLDKNKLNSTGYDAAAEGKFFKVENGNIVLTDAPTSSGVDDDVLEAIFPITLEASITPGGLHEQGDNVEFTVNGALKRKGAALTGCSYYLADAKITVPHKLTLNESDSFTFKGVTEDGETTKTQQLSVSFSNKYYWGVVNQGWAPTSDSVKALSGSLLSLPKDVTQKFSPAAQCIAFASLTPLTKIVDGNGFNNIGSFTEHANVSVTNAHGVVCTYHVYVLTETVTQKDFPITFVR